MKNKKLFLLALLPALMASLLSGCNGQKSSYKSDDEEEKPLEIGDTVKEWTSSEDLDVPPMDNNGEDKGEICEDNGSDDECSIYFNISAGNGEEGYIGSDVLENPYFLEDDAKNGDIISLYFYAPEGSNLSSLQLELFPISMNEPISGELVKISEENEGKWIRTVASFDTLETLGAIRLNYVVANQNQPTKFYIDQINITLGEETVETGYVYNDESLCTAFEDYFKVGTCMSSNMLRNTTLRKILKNDFNSVTAENEGKPEQILDQAACQEAAKTNKASVVITTKPFEKLYDFAEANHIGVRHHTFVWYSQTPAWFFTEDYTQGGKQASRQLMLDRMDNFFRVTMNTLNDRWPGLVYAIDVANEAIENGLRTNNNNWYNTVGEDFVARAFEYAYQYKDEDQELYYNDFSFDYNVNNCEFALNTLLKEPIENGWIDGVGIQGHIDSNQNMDVIINDAKMIYEKGLKCQITELDITINGTDEANLNKQKDAYKLLTKRILESNDIGETDINAFVVWGITDNASWKRGQNPLLYDSNYAKKPCYYGCLEALDEFIYA